MLTGLERFFLSGGWGGEEVAEINSRFIVYVARWMLISFTDMGTWKLLSRFVEFISQFRLSYAEVTNDPQILVAYKNRLACPIWPQWSAAFLFHILFTLGPRVTGCRLFTGPREKRGNHALVLKALEMTHLTS